MPMHVLQQENESLRRQLDALLREARCNEEKMQRFDRFERRLIATRSLAGLAGLLGEDYRAAFELDTVSLALLDPEYEIARVLEADGEAPARGNLLLQASGFALENLYRPGTAPILAAFDPAEHGFLFPGVCPASVALLPLVCQGRLLGSLNLGSHAAERFTADRGTQFLGRLAAIAAVCLENALNHERLQLIGLTDPLTGVNNRRYFESRLQEEVTRARRHGQALTCMFIDIDRFKRINDTFGHQAGDEVLRGVAALVKGQLRGCDLLARYGGEEFVILLPQTAIRHACDIAERIRARVAAGSLLRRPGGSLVVTVSVGVADLPAAAAGSDGAAAAADLVRRADEAVYRAKQTGRNRVVSDGEAPPLTGTLAALRKALGALRGHAAGRPL